MDRQVLAGQVLGQRAAVGGGQDEGGDPVGLLGLGADGEGSVPGPPAGLIELLLIQLGFAADADVGEVAVCLGDCRGDLRGDRIAEDLGDGGPPAAIEANGFFAVSDAR